MTTTELTASKRGSSPAGAPAVAGSFGKPGSGRQKRGCGRRAMAANYSHWCMPGPSLRRAKQPKSRPQDDDSTAARSQHERLTNRSTQELEMSTHTASQTAT